MKLKTKKALLSTSIALSTASLVAFGNPAFSETIKVEAESFVNVGGSYADGNPSQPDAVNVYSVNGESGINWVNAGDFVDYYVVADGGVYSVEYLVGTNIASNANIELFVNQNGSWISQGTVGVPLGAWDDFQPLVHSQQVTLPAGVSQLRVQGVGADWQWNMESFSLSSVAEPTPTPTPTPTPGDGYPFDHNGDGLIWGYVSGAKNWNDANPNYEVSENLLRTEDAIGGNTTEVFTGTIYDADGDISFFEHIDDSVRLYIDGNLVLSDDSWENSSQTANLNLTPGTHSFELRIGNADGGSGPVGDSIGFGIDVNGGTNFVHPSTLATNIFNATGTINGDPNRVPPGGIVIELEDFDATGTTGRVGGDPNDGFVADQGAVNVSFVTNGDWGDYYNVYLEAGTYRSFLYASTGQAGSYGARIDLDGWPVSWGYFDHTGGYDIVEEVELYGGDFVVEESRNYTVRVKAVGGNDWQWSGDKVRFAKVSEDSVRPSALYNPNEHTVSPIQGPSTGLQYLKEPVTIPQANKVLKSDVWYTYAQNNELEGYSVEETGATGSFWGHPPEDNFYDESEIIEWAGDVQDWQDLGIEFIARGEFDWGFRWATEYLTNPEPHYVKTLDDRNVRMTFMGYLSYNGYNNNWLSNHSPAFVPFMKSQVDQLLKANPDKLMFDTQTNSTRTTDMRTFGGDFSEYAMQNFRVWLGEKYTNAELSALGISDINTFDYAEFLIAQGVTHTSWSNAGNTISGNIPLLEDFIYFNRDVWNQKFSEVLDYVREQRPDISIGASTQLFESRGYLFNENITFLSNELFMDMQLPLTELPTNIVAQYKAAQAVDKPLALFPYPSEFNALRLNDSTRYARGWIAQAYAYGGLFSIPAAVWVGDDALPLQTWNIPAENYRDIYRFVRDNDFLFDDYTSYSKVGLVHAMYSSMKANLLNGGNQILSSTRILTLDNINFDLLVFGDEGYPVVPRSEDFDQFDYIFTDGDLSLLTAEQKSVLDNQGSKVRHIGQRGTIDGLAINVSVNGSVSNETVSAVSRVHETNASAPYVVHLINRPFAGGVTPTLNGVEVAIPQSYFPESVTTATLHLPGGASTNLPVSTNGDGDAVVTVNDLEVWGILELGH
ncbi:carbohydrate-binding protein [Gilvimarinus agarilyticus]|uniref:carbohydrate-binding protein n=1 Tax=Gilvimarinus sp. 2_MG-2023 TaxID=3062666 RepID=UPI001C0815B9|nr:carbohydrate-binding protein [Gilvimarinus sp. 2_MG-2023]MBU2887699.1 carbohydrate-binding protein [Gilvimarinus agarilyticus]MDO6572346.1 carbohydrate-binding protein [Gilvimarinus sp. 2_MG-2023]